MPPPHQQSVDDGHTLVEALAVACRTAPRARGKVALAFRLMRRAERHGGLQGTWRVRLKDGTRLELPRQSRQSWMAAFQGLYDDAAVRYLARFIEPGTLVLDVGASLGLWSVQLGRLAAARGAAVRTFEPNPANTPWIARNIELNGLSDVVSTNEMGLGDATEQVTLISAEYGVGNGVIAVDGHTATTKFPSIPIEVRRLDDVDLDTRVSLIKIDTEGYEVAFLRGATALIERDRPVIFGEFSTPWLVRRGEDLRSALAELDYEVAALLPSRSRPWRSLDVVTPVEVDLASEAPLPENLLLRPR